VHDVEPSCDGERSVTQRPPEPHPRRGGGAGSG
jgi:hypothetical protein